MEDGLDATALATVSLLEARLLRIEHLLYGGSLPARPSTTPTAESLADLERRFASLLANFKVYADLLNVCKCFFCLTARKL